MVNAPTIQKTKNVVVLGGSYSGARAAEQLSHQLPDGYRVIMIDRQSHFNHLYKYVRYSVVPGHAHKAFIPYTNLLHAPLISDTTCSPPASLSESKNLVCQASVVNLTSSHVEIDKELCEIEGITEAEPDVVDELGEVQKKLWGRQKGQECCGNPENCLANITMQSGRKTCAGTRIPYDYLVYALGSHLPRPLASPARTKKDNINFLKAQQDAIYKSESILIVGGGALGIQYATDIKELYPHKKVTLIHSRPRLMPVFDPRLHEETMKRFEELGVECILSDRVILPPHAGPPSSEPEGRITTRTEGGRSIESDLRIFATGQKPNSALMRTLTPDACDQWGYIKVLRTMQLANPDFPHVFGVGDVVDGHGAIKAGHTGWNQSNVAVHNIVEMIKAEQEGLPAPNLQEYSPGVPMIKLTLGLTKSVTQLCSPEDPSKVEIKLNDDHDIDPYWESMWSAMKVDAKNPHA